MYMYVCTLEWVGLVPSTAAPFSDVLVGVALFFVCISLIFMYVHMLICDRARINQPYAAIYNLRVHAFIGDSRPSRP